MASTNVHSIFRAKGFSCPSCVNKIEKQIGVMPGIDKVEVKFASGRIEVDYDPEIVTTDSIIDTIGKAGYDATLSAF